MTRNLKVLGLALVAVLALSGLAAGAAQAETAAKFWSEGTTIDTLPDSTFQEYEDTTGSKIKCATPTGHGAYEGESAELTAHEVKYDTCNAEQFGISFPATVESGADCHYTFTAGTKTKGKVGDGSDDNEGLSHGSVHICEQTINVYNSPHPGGTMRCQIHVAPQTITGITFINKTTEGKMAVTIEANKVGVTETKTNFGTLGCNSHSTTVAKYTGRVWAKATNIENEYVNTTVT